MGVEDGHRPRYGKRPLSTPVHLRTPVFVFTDLLLGSYFWPKTVVEQDTPPPEMDESPGPVREVRDVGADVEDVREDITSLTGVVGVQVEDPGAARRGVGETPRVCVSLPPSPPLSRDPSHPRPTPFGSFHILTLGQRHGSH